MSTRRNLKAIRRAAQRKAYENRQSRAKTPVELFEKLKEMLELDKK